MGCFGWGAKSLIQCQSINTHEGNKGQGLVAQPLDPPCSAIGYRYTISPVILQVSQGIALYPPPPPPNPLYRSQSGKEKDDDHDQDFLSKDVLRIWSWSSESLLLRRRKR